MKTHYTIGEFSTMFGLNVQTLRYYDSIGLFQPQQRGAQNGRRYYNFEQVYKLASIRYLRRLGYSLQGIVEYMDNREAGVTLEHLKKRSADLRRQLEELLLTESVIQRKISFIEYEMAQATDLDAIAVRTFEERRYIPIGQEEQLYFDDSFYLNPTIAFYNGQEKTFGAYLFEGVLDPGATPRMRPEDVAVIPAGDFLCSYHCGPYEEIGRSIARLRAARPALALESRTINFNVIDQFVEKDGDKYITSIQIQVLGR